MSKPGITI